MLVAELPEAVCLELRARLELRERLARPVFRHEDGEGPDQW